MSLNLNKPTAYITVNKGRKKIKNDVVYMDNGTEFELELYNPTKETVLSKIWINNKIISYTGIVLRPGERVFLERYLDKPNKFKFETYNVNGNSEEVAKAIEDNGIIKVEFYDENIIPTINLNTSHSGNFYVGDNITFTNGTLPVYGGSVYYSNTNSTLDGTYNTTSLTTNSSNTSYQGPNIRSKKTKSLETGRVEEGSHSSQTFETVNKKFHHFPTSSVEYHIKPTSQKVMESSDLKRMNKYCTKCGRKGKISDNFCAGCGNRF